MIEKFAETAAKSLEKTVESAGESQSIPHFALTKMTGAETDIQKADQVSFQGVKPYSGVLDDLIKAFKLNMEELFKELPHVGIHLFKEFAPKFGEEIKTYFVNTFQQADQPLSSGNHKTKGHPAVAKNELKFNQADHISFGGYYYTGPNGEKLYKAGDGHIYDVNGNKVG